LPDLYGDDWAFVDHRPMGWDSNTGPEGALDLVRSGFTVTLDLHVEVHDVLACDDRVIAMRIAWVGSSLEGGGKLELPVGVVCAIEGGQFTTYDQYEPDDTEAMVARYAELSGRREVVLGDCPPERWYAEFRRRWDAHDLDGLIELYADDWVMTDRRSIALWDVVRGREAQAEINSSALAASPDTRFEVDELIACDERVIALRASWRGSNVDGGGEVRVAVGAVSVVDGGRHVSMDVYDPDDRQAMIARYAELGGGAGPLGDRPPERVVAEYVRAYAGRDLEAVVRLVDEDWVLVDHRSLGWGELRGREGFTKLMTSSWDAWSDVRLEIDALLACDRRVVAMQATFRGTNVDGGGPSAIPLGFVISSTGMDLYEPDHHDAMLARFAELTGKVRHRGLGDSPVERLVAEVNRSFNEHEFERHLEQHAEEFVLVDHRSLGWAVVRGRNAFGELIGSALGVSDDVRFDLEEVLACDGERVIAMRGAWRSDGSRTAGPWEIPVGYVTVFENGLIASHDFYDYNDLDALRSRFDVLSRAAAEIAERPYARFDRLYNERRLDEIPALYTEDFVMVDRRSMAWEEIRGGEALLETCRSFLDNAPDLRSRCKPLVEDDGDDVFLVRNTFTGQGFTVGGASAGEVELVFDEVTVIRDGLMCRTELFDPADEALARARYEELRAPYLTPGWRAAATFDRLFNEKRFDELADLYTEDFVMIDHRQLGWEERHGQQVMVEQCRSTVQTAPDQRSCCESLLDDGGDVVMYRDTFSSDGHEGVGPWELVLDLVIVLRDGRVARIESFEPADEEVRLARYEELRDEHTTPAADL
jgi:ketosteroid isomerase-like protein